MVKIIRDYDDNGNLSIIHLKINDKIEGVERDFYNFKQFNTFYVNNNRHGIHTGYTLPNHLICIYTYYYDVLYGKYIEYYDNGNVSRSGFRRADFKIGEYRKYKSNGNIMRLQYYSIYGGLKFEIGY